MTAWILLRGLTRERRHWGGFPAIFKRAMPAAEVLTLDLPGNGFLHGKASPTRVEDMAEFCRADLRARGIPPPYHLLAMSLGAMVAVAWAAAHRQEIEASVLINTSLRPFSTFTQRLRPRNYPALLQLAFLGNDDRAAEALILRLTSNHPERHRDVLEDWLSYRRECPVSGRNALRQLFAASRYLAPSTQPCERLLILASATDALVDPRCSRRIARQWPSEIFEHPSAGHDIPLDDGPWVAEKILSWL